MWKILRHLEDDFNHCEENFSNNASNFSQNHPQRPSKFFPEKTGDLLRTF